MSNANKLTENDIKRLFNFIFYQGEKPTVAAIELHVHLYKKTEDMQGYTTIPLPARPVELTTPVPISINSTGAKKADIDILFFYNKELVKIEVSDVPLQVENSPNPITIQSLFLIAVKQYGGKVSNAPSPQKMGYVVHTFGGQDYPSTYRVRKVGIEDYEVHKKEGKNWKGMIVTSPRIKAIIKKFKEGNYQTDLEQKEQ